MPEHTVPRKVYFRVFGALIALTALTTWLAFINLGRLNTVAALAIAVSKATLVALFFMHLRYSAHLTRLVLVAALLWLAILVTLTLSDFLTRDWTPPPRAWETSSAAQGEAKEIRGGVAQARTAVTGESGPSRFRSRP